jgi:hypothetical protein
LHCVATDLGKDRGKVPDRECRNNAAPIFCNEGQMYMQIVSDMSASSNVLHGALRPVMCLDVITTYRYRVKDKTQTTAPRVWRGDLRLELLLCHTA